MIRLVRMKAITCTRYGPPSVLQLADLEKPVPGDDEVLIRVRAAEVTKADIEIRRFRFAVKWFWLPMRLAFGIRRPRRPVLGGYFAGEVTATGRHVTRLSVGDEVFGSAGVKFGAYAQFLALPARYTIAAKPGNMSFAEAAAVPLGGLNALHFMRLAALQEGESVLINGAGGSIGAHAIQIAASMGATVTAVDCGRKEAFVRGLGAARFIDYEREDFATAGETYDVIFDMVPGSDYGACIRTLNPGGRYLSGNPRLWVMLRCLLTTRFTDKTARFAFAGEKIDELVALADMIEAGTIRPIVDQVYPMEQVVAAHERVESERRLGAIVIAI